MAPGSAGSLGANAAIVIDTVAPTAPTLLSAIGVGGITTDHVGYYQNTFNRLLRIMSKIMTQTPKSLRI
jgi:hypothetical protein